VLILSHEDPLQRVFIGERRGSNYEKDCDQQELRQLFGKSRGIFTIACTGSTGCTSGKGSRSLLARGRNTERTNLNQCGQLIDRDDLKLVQVVEELGAAANGHGAELRVVAIPDDIQWEITAVGGVERISEVHRTWSLQPDQIGWLSMGTRLPS